MPQLNMDNKKLITYLTSAGVGLGTAIAGVFIVAPNEGYNPKPYVDPVGIATACLGHTGSDVRIGGKVFTQDECLNKFAKDLSKADQSVHRIITVPLTVYQEAALVSFTYNVGEGNLAKSSLAKAFNNGDYSAGCTGLLAWVYAGKQKLKGLETRRQQEFNMCMGRTNTEVD